MKAHLADWPIIVAYGIACVFFTLLDFTWDVPVWIPLWVGLTIGWSGPLLEAWRDYRTVVKRHRTLRVVDDEP